MGRLKIGPSSSPRFFEETEVVSVPTEVLVEEQSEPVIQTVIEKQEVIQYIDRIVEVIKEVPVEVIKDKIEYQIVEVIKEVPVEVKVEVIREVEKPVEIIKEKIVQVIKKVRYVPVVAKVAMILQTLVIIYLLIR